MRLTGRHMQRFRTSLPPAAHKTSEKGRNRARKGNAAGRRRASLPRPSTLASSYAAPPCNACISSGRVRPLKSSPFLGKHSILTENALPGTYFAHCSIEPPSTAGDKKGRKGRHHTDLHILSRRLGHKKGRKGKTLPSLKTGLRGDKYRQEVCAVNQRSA